VRAEGYVLSVYCDAPGCRAQEPNMYGHNKVEAFTRTRAKGWVLGTSDYCTAHAHLAVERRP